MPVVPKRPYLIRALLDWIVDSELTPYLMVAVDSDQVRVPADYVSEGKIILNISPMAVQNLEVTDVGVSFAGRFGGKPFAVHVPRQNVLAIYAKETGEGMMFDPADDQKPEIPPDGQPLPDKPGGHLKVIK